MHTNKGIALVALIVVVVIVAIVVTGITIAVTSNLRFTTFYTQKLQALAAAQAGIYAAIADYQRDPVNPYWDKIHVGTVLAGGESYGVGVDANFLLVDATGANITTTTVQGINISNINATQPIVMNKMTVSWGTTGRTLRGITINSAPQWSGIVSSGTAVNLNGAAGYSMAAAQANPVAIVLTFSGSMTGDTINITFGFNGPPVSARTVTVINAGQPTSRSFSITSTGRVGDYRRTIETVCSI